MNSGPIRIADKMQDVSFVSSLPKSRSDAFLFGSKIYIGAVCKNNHNSYRFTVNGVCAQCTSDSTNLRIKSGKTKDYSEIRNKNWNSSQKAISAKQQWKERDPVWAWIVSAVGGARTRAKYKNLAFDLTNEYIKSITPNHCPVLGIELTFGGTKKVSATSASIDRINPDRGYVVGNVAVISSKANIIKSNATADEIRKVADWLQLQG
jgi:hypothetical protein